MPTLLAGCQPEPLSSYLKALGVLRIVAQQVDSAATGHWETEGFVIASVLDVDGLVNFFAASYIPSPIVSPWNGGSGFHPKDNTDAITAIEVSTDPRFDLYRRTIEMCRRILADTRPSKDQKFDIIQACRSQLPDEALPWLDAAVVLLDGDVAFPPLLGTGGNDGRLDFSNNFMQRLVLLLGIGGRMPAGATPQRWFRAALDGTNVAGIKAAIGQFDPGAAGGPNSGPIAAADSVVNPADFVLLVEGATAIASGSTKRLSSALGVGSRGPKRAAMPFTVEATPAGYPSAVPGEDGRGELWLPLWGRPAKFGEIQRLFSEGRCTWSGHTARTGLDAARAAVTLGVDRGIDAFARCVLVTRNGLATVAVPVARVEVAERPEVNVLASLDRWLDRVKRGRNPPSALRSSIAALERAMFAAAASGLGLLDVLGAAAAVDAVVATAGTFRSEVDPLRLEAGRWSQVILDAAGDPAVGREVRLAVGLASLRDGSGDTFSTMAEGLRPVHRNGRRLVWTERPAVTGLGRRPLQEVLAAAHARRWLPGGQAEGSMGGTFEYGVEVSRGDATALASGDVHPIRLGRYLSALLVLDWYGEGPRLPELDFGGACPALSLLAPAFGPVEGVSPNVAPKPKSTWAAMLSNRSARSLHLVLGDARRRIATAGWRPLVSSSGVAEGTGDSHFLGAALLLRMSPRARRRLLEQVALPNEPSLIRGNDARR